MKKVISIFITVFTVAIAFAQQDTTTNSKKVLSDSTLVYAENDMLHNLKVVNISKLEIPQLKPKENIITHFAYSLSYNETHEQANWVAYELTSEETNGDIKRTDKFISDPLVKSGTANDKDYLGSGYDRGHLAPAGDMSWSITAMNESFYYSNMSPQNPSCNRGIWKQCEDLVRTWAVDNQSLYITTGPVLVSNLPTIGNNKVSVPNYYYKVILDYTAPSVKAIGFIIPNAGSKEPLQNFAVSIDSVEKVTGINFFPLLPDHQEDIIESTINLNAWTWKSSTSTNSDAKQPSSVSYKSKTNNSNPSATAYPTKTETKNSSTSAQCTGTTKKGMRCRNMTTNLNGRCYLH